MSTDQFSTLAGESTGEVREQASRFMAYAFPIADEAAFKLRLSAIAKDHHSARHICYAWVLGVAGERFRAFDAGEPAGSAGRPILRQLQGAGLTHCAIVVVRYFGGTLLGKAGLAHAFADAAKEALAHNNTVQRTLLARVEITCGYDLVEAVKRQVAMAGGTVDQAEYLNLCTLVVAMPKSLAEDFAAKWNSEGASARVLAPTKA